jgi:hypothetical protein
MTDCDIRSTPNWIRGRWDGSETSSGRCQGTQTRPTSSAAWRAVRRPRSSGRRKARQPSSSNSPTMTNVAATAATSCGRSASVNDGAGAPSRTDTAAAPPAATPGTRRAAAYQPGCTTHRVKDPSKRATSWRPPAQAQTRTAASAGPNGTSGLLSGFARTSGQMLHERPNARSRYNPTRCLPAHTLGRLTVCWSMAPLPGRFPRRRCVRRPCSRTGPPWLEV